MFCKTEGCENYTENNATWFCASCNRKARKVLKPKKTHQIKPISAKKAKAKAAKIKTYQVMDDNTAQFCAGCGSANYPLSHSHIIPVGQYPEFEATPENIVYDCLTIGDHKGCHDIWEHGTWKEKHQLLNYHARIEVIKKLCLPYLKRLLLR